MVIRTAQSSGKRSERSGGMSDLGSTVLTSTMFRCASSLRVTAVAQWQQRLAASSFVPSRPSVAGVVSSSSSPLSSSSSRALISSSAVSADDGTFGGDGRCGLGRRRLRIFPQELNVIYDSKCNVCRLEIDFLRRRDERINQQQPKLLFTDLESGTYNESDPRNGGVSYGRGMASIHAVTASGQVLSGVPVFEMAYQQVQLGWLFRITHVPGFKQMANLGYWIFAKYRTILTRGGRSVPQLVQLYEEKKQLEGAAQCNNNTCPPIRK